MKKSISRMLLLAPVALSLTACGLDLGEVYESDGYNNVVFKKNYYQKYSSQIEPKTNDKNPLKDGVRNDSIRTVKTIKNPMHTTKFLDATVFDPEISLLDLKYELNTQPQDPETSPYFGDRRKLNLTDDQFKFGYLSKLYDGWMFCGGRFQLSRVQIDERGFGQIFEKEMIQSDYFALQFKASMNDPYYQDINTRSEAWYVPPLESKIKLNINFYCRDGNAYDVTNVCFDINNVPTNYKEFDPEAYMFLAFSLKDLNLERCCGYSINYELDMDHYLDQAKNPPKVSDPLTGLETDEFTPISDEQTNRIEHALMLYEVFMPNSRWR